MEREFMQETLVRPAGSSEAAEMGACAQRARAVQRAEAVKPEMKWMSGKITAG